MKTILVPTDFSDGAQNALDYAIEMVKHTKAKLILFHAYHIPAIPSDAPFVMPVGDMEKDALKALNKIKKNIQIKNENKFKIECATKLGFAIDEINGFIEEKKIDLVIMGVHGAGYLSEKLIGSITTTLIRKAKCPVLAIHEKVKFKNIKKIVLACDYEKINDKSIFNALKQIIKLFKSHLYILNVTPELESITPTRKIMSGTLLNESFKDIAHSFKFTENDDIVEGINDFVLKNNIDMIVMIPRKHSLIETIFQERNTKRMAFHTHIPILALPE